jgi:hypothetical protein
MGFGAAGVSGRKRKLTVAWSVVCEEGALLVLSMHCLRTWC